MEKQLQYLLSQAAALIEKGEATIENAFLMALEQDNERSINCINALTAPNKQHYRGNGVATSSPICAKDKDWGNALDVVCSIVHTNFNQA